MTNEETFIPTPEHPQASAPEAQVATTPPVHQSEAAFRVGDWSGLPNYECNACPFSTLDLPVMEEHQKIRHAPQPEQALGATPKRRYMRRE